MDSHAKAVAKTSVRAIEVITRGLLVEGSENSDWVRGDRAQRSLADAVEALVASRSV